MLGIKKLKHSIEECDHREEKEKLIREAQERTVDQRDDLMSEKEAATTRDAAMIDSLSCTEYAVLRRVLVWLAIILEATNVPFQYIVLTVGFPSLSSTTRWVLSPFIAVGEAALVHAIAYAGLFDRVRPRRTVRVCLRLAGALGIIVAIAGTILLFSRTASAEMVPFLLHVVPVSLWLVAEGLPIVAGLVAAAAHVLHHPVIQRTRIRRLDLQIAELNRLLSWLETELDKLSGMKVSASKLTAVLLLAATFLAGPHSATAQTTNNQAGSSATTAHVAGSAPHSEPTRVCNILVDWSRSLSETARREAVGRIRETAPELVREFGCEILKVGRFSDEGPFAPVVQVNGVGSIDPPCQNSNSATGVAKVFASISGFADFYRKKAQQDCARAISQALDQQRRGEEALQGKIEEILNPSIPPRGECTAIRDLVVHHLRALPRLLVVVTDGAESCSSSRSAINVPAGTTLVFVVVPSKGELRTTAPAAMQRAHQWEKLLFNLVIAVPSDIAPRFWLSLAANK